MNVMALATNFLIAIARVVGTIGQFVSTADGQIDKGAKSIVSERCYWPSAQQQWAS